MCLNLTLFTHPPSISILSGLLPALSPKAALKILVRWQTPVMSESYNLHMQKRRQSSTGPRWQPFELLLIFGFDWPQILIFLAISLYLENISPINRFWILYCISPSSQSILLFFFFRSSQRFLLLSLFNVHVCQSFSLINITSCISVRSYRREEAYLHLESEKKIKENKYMVIKMDFQKNVWDQSIAYFLNQ